MDNILIFIFFSQFTEILFPASCDIMAIQKWRAQAEQILAEPLLLDLVMLIISLYMSLG